jgi:acyl-coenzyme A thioesterase PaaI-like protein
MCFVCGRENNAGLHLTFYEDHEAKQLIAPLNIPEHFQGYPGIVHGGVVTAILDELSGRSINIGMEEEQFWVTAKLEMRFRQPTPTNTPLTAVGWVERQRQRTAEVAGEIRLPDGTVTAEIKALIICPPEKTIQGWEEEKQHWRVER